jgi:Skp family chaperone for outer membrane proteins
MKVRLLLLCCVLGITALFARDVFSNAESIGPVLKTQSKIGVVSMLQLIRERAQEDKQMGEIMAERSKARAELSELAKEIDSEEAGLRTLKPGTEDYTKQIEQLMEKKLRLESRREAPDRMAMLRQQIWTQKVFNQIVRITRQLAAEKGLDVVLSKDEPETLPTGEGFMTGMGAQKVLYSGGCVDLTDEVRSRLRTEKPQ